MPLTALQRRLLSTVAVLGLFGINGVFAYEAFFHPGDVMAELHHPVAVAFIAEAFALVVLGAAILRARPLGRHGAATFVALSLLGGVLFSVPAILLLNDQPVPDGTGQREVR